MALFYFDMRPYSRSPRAKNHTVAASVQAYLTRTQSPERAIDYLERRRDHAENRDDLVHTESAFLPLPVTAEQFFETAYTHERRNGRWATAMQMALPRELTREQQLALTRTFLYSTLQNHPMLWVMHEPTATDGRPQPHVHVLFTERQNDGVERSLPGYFRRAPIGARKDRFLNERRHVTRFREAWADHVNATLEACGHSARVDPRSLATRGVERTPTPKLYPYRKETARPVRRDAVLEQERATEWWEARKQGYDLSQPLAPQIVQRMRQGEPGRYPRRDLERETRDAQVMLQVREHLVHDFRAAREQIRGAPGTRLLVPGVPILPSQATTIWRLQQRAQALHVSGEREQIHAGAQMHTEKGETREYER